MKTKDIDQKATNCINVESVHAIFIYISEICTYANHFIIRTSEIRTFAH